MGRRRFHRGRRRPSGAAASHVLQPGENATEVDVGGARSVRIAGANAGHRRCRASREARTVVPRSHRFPWTERILPHRCRRRRVRRSRLTGDHLLLVYVGRVGHVAPRSTWTIRRARNRRSTLEPPTSRQTSSWRSKSSASTRQRLPSARRTSPMRAPRGPRAGRVAAPDRSQTGLAEPGPQRRSVERARDQRQAAQRVPGARYPSCSKQLVSCGSRWCWPSGPLL